MDSATSSASRDSTSNVGSGPAGNDVSDGALGAETGAGTTEISTDGGPGDGSEADSATASAATTGGETTAGKQRQIANQLWRRAKECMAASVEGARAGNHLPETKKVTLAVSNDPNTPGYMLLSSGLSQTVDADAPDPEAIALKLGPPLHGSPDAAVKLVECFDYNCIFSSRARGTIARIVSEYADTVALFQLHHPLSWHVGAHSAAWAATAARNQGRYPEMSDLLFDNLDKRSDADFVAFADALGLDTALFVHDYNSEATRASVDEQIRTCVGNGALGTPAFFVNGDPVVGAQYEKLKAIIDGELALGLAGGQ